MKTILNILAFLVILAMGIGIGFATTRINRNTPIVKLVPVQSPIPSQREIQQRLTDLNEPRYDPNGVDGVIGKNSRTAWDNFICDMHAKRAVEGE